MADSKDFTAGVDSNAKKSPRRIVFITRRTSACLLYTSRCV